MSLQLKIDTNALMTLFPEGSEARLELQQAVLSEVAKRTFKVMTDSDIADALRPVVDETKKEVLEEYGELKFTNLGHTLIPSREFCAAIKKVIGDEIANFLNKEVKLYLEESLLRKVRALEENAIRNAQIMINKTYEQNFQQRLEEINKFSQGTQS